MGQLGVHNIFRKLLTKLQKEMAHNVIMLKGTTRGSYLYNRVQLKEALTGFETGKSVECDCVLNPDKVVTQI